jgi:C4-dicarboxylate-specific signal transduction histidine kinase
MVKEGTLKRSTINEFSQRMIDMGALLLRSCTRVAHLVISFKQIAVDQTSEHRRAFDLREVIDDNVAALRPSLKTATWVIEVDVPTGIACDSYPGPLGQVLTNLIQNAAIHAFEGRESGLLRLSASVDAGTVRLVMSDNGQGMSASTLVHIFEPFYTTKLGKGGSGLGLAICRNMATGILGGQLTATSQQGAGSEFVLTFPAIAPIASIAKTSPMSTVAIEHGKS